MDNTINTPHGSIDRKYLYGLLLLIAAAATRFYGLGSWAIDGDEIFSYQRGLSHHLHFNWQ